MNRKKNVRRLAPKSMKKTRGGSLAHEAVHVVQQPKSPEPAGRKIIDCEGYASL
jgi:hypothetical protein